MEVKIHDRTIKALKNKEAIKAYIGKKVEGVEEYEVIMEDLEDLVQTKKKIKFRDLVSPDIHYFSVRDIEIYFEVFKWMAESGYGVRGVRETLSGKPTCIHFDMITPFTKDWRDELKHRFEVILNSRLVTPEVREWKERNKIDLCKERIVPLRIRKKKFWLDRINAESFINKIFELEEANRVFKEPQNIVHKEAIVLTYIEFVIVGYGGERYNGEYKYEFRIHYGFKKEDCYSWHYKISSEENEILSDFCERAYKELIEKTEQICEDLNEKNNKIKDNI